MTSPHRFRTLLAALALSVLAGCASYQSIQQAEEAERAGDWDSAVLYYSKAIDESPDNVQYRMALERARNAACIMHFEKGKKHMDAGNLEEAIVEFQQALNLNPAHQYAFTELQRAARLLREKKEREKPAEKTLDDMKREAERKQPIGAPAEALPLVPGKDRHAVSRSDRRGSPLDPREDLRDHLPLRRLSVRKDQKVSPDFSDVDFQEALELVMLMTNNTYTVVSDKVLMVYPDTQSKRREWEDQVIKTFYLSNADLKETMDLLRVIIDARRIAQVTGTNALTVKDTPERVAAAGRVIAAIDKARPEVVIDVEVLEVDQISDSEDRMTIPVEVHDKRFGVIAAEKGFMTKEQLFEAMKIQVEEDVSGKPHTLIGIILIKLGYLTKEEADDILLTMKKK